MWTIIKFDKRNLEFLKKDFKEKLGEGFTIYNPKLFIQKYKRNKLINKEKNRNMLTKTNIYMEMFNRKPQKTDTHIHSFFGNQLAEMMDLIFMKKYANNKNLNNNFEIDDHPI